MSATVTTTAPTVIADVSAASTVSSSRVLQFGAIVTQLALLLAVFWLFRLEEPAFLVLSATVFAGFMVSYWLPLTWKEPFFVALCIGGALLIAEPLVVLVVIALLASVFAVVQNVAGLAIASRLRSLANSRSPGCRLLCGRRSAPCSCSA